MQEIFQNPDRKPDDNDDLNDFPEYAEYFHARFRELQKPDGEDRGKHEQRKQIQLP